ncbi:hypothetical protein SERLA73DRAFT_148782 [Serpula lacrymans var. lacrymans S7.3]|uniref:Helicase ATP-binding domain-containing protein n=1 Tax=Serpula lacrymans var. lacrymans (strain S7.3) TaxID=936435 RepID=F8PET8_SERL3|nr:hypothetical protein SERLA73DRAFT_148782 [Serpula lacrymans var. lacrymans S7.3]
MPSFTIAGALLALADPDNDPWGWGQWQSLTGYHTAPWLVDNGPQNIVHRSAQTREAVSSFVSLFFAAHVDEKLQVTQRKSDSHVEGRAAWTSFVSANWKLVWKVQDLIDSTLKEQSCGPYEVMSRRQSRELPTLERAQVKRAYPFLAHALFGEDGTVDTTASFLKDNVQDFIERYLASSDKVITLLQRYTDPESVKQIEDQRQQLIDMLGAMGLDKSGKSNKMRVPKLLRDALEKLATTDQVSALECTIHEFMERLTDQDMQNIPTLDFKLPPAVAWKEGVEDFADKSEDNLWRMLGLGQMRALPHFQTKTNPTASIKPWSIEGQTWLEENNAAVPLRPKWHQVVGIVKMMDKVLKGEPLLLMNEVGVGKTMQAVGVIACTAYFRDFYQTHEQFPGMFSKYKCISTGANLPDLPTILVCPTNLHAQLTSEIEHYLRRGTFDLLPYTGKLQQREQWWETIWTQSKMSPGRCIVLVPQTALQSDSDTIWVASDHDTGAQPRFALLHNKWVKQTVYGQQWGLFVMDEAHVARKYNRIYVAMRALHQQANVTIVLTATPVLTRPSDNLDTTLLRIMVGNDKYANEEASEYRSSILNWMNVMRDKFAGSVIRRTVDSKDCNQQPISGLPPHTEHPLLVLMYDWERKNLHNIVKELVDDHPTAAYYGAGKRNTDSVTVKLDVLGKVLDYHLEQDGRQPVTAADNGRDIQPDDHYGSFDLNPAEPDKIVVYSAFPTSNQAILDILSIYGIKAVELNGSVPLRKHQAAIDAFRMSTRDSGPRVLILSGVGMDTLWSDQEDAQLRGCVWHQPQPKQVHVYRLVATGTSDVFLNNISFDKGVMHAVFVGTEVVIRKAFLGHAEEDDALLSLVSDDDQEHIAIGNDMDVDEPTSPKATGKGKAKTKPKRRVTRQEKGKKLDDTAKGSSLRTLRKRKPSQEQLDATVVKPKKTRKSANVPLLSTAGPSSFSGEHGTSTAGNISLPDIETLRASNPNFDRDPYQDEDAAMAALQHGFARASTEPPSSPLSTVPPMSESEDVTEGSTKGRGRRGRGSSGGRGQRQSSRQAAVRGQK